MNKLFFILFFLTGCNYTGFSEQWKERYIEECVSGAQEYTPRNKAEAYCNCSLDLVMEKYTSDLVASADLLLMNEDEVIEFVQSCL